MHVRSTRDKAHIQAILETDRGYSAYALGDLDEVLFERCGWWAAESDGRAEALALVYYDFHPPVLFIMGSAVGAAALVEQIEAPREVYLNVRQEHLAAIETCYRVRELELMWRMALPAPARAAGETHLDSNVSLSPKGSAPACPRVFTGVATKQSQTWEETRLVRLAPGDVERLQALYALGGGDAFSSQQLALGVFFGVEQDGRLLSAAGTHLVSDMYSVGAIGNVMTHPGHRGRRLAQQATGAVCRELQERGIRTIVLNVRQDNTPAVRVYDELGFARHCPYLEGKALRP